MLLLELKTKFYNAFTALIPLILTLLIINILDILFFKQIYGTKILGSSNINEGLLYLLAMTSSILLINSTPTYKKLPRSIPLFIETYYAPLLTALFFFSFLLKSFYLNFNYSSDYLSYESILRKVFLEGNWLYEMDDSPLYTAICFILFKIYGSINYSLIVIFQLFLGCVTIIIAVDIFRIVTDSKIYALISGFLLATYFQSTMWEVIIRYDSFATFLHVFGFYALIRFYKTPSRSNMILLIGGISLSLLGKETIIYMLPFYLLFLFIGSFIKKQIKISQILTISVLTLAIALPPIAIKNKIYKERFGLISNKKPIVLLWNVHLFNILDKSNKTKYPEIRDELIAFYDQVFNEDERKKDIIHKTVQQMSKYHSSTNERYFQTNSQNQYTELARIEPFLNETVFFDIPKYTLNSVIRYLYNVNLILPSLPKPTFEKFEALLYKNKILLFINHFFLPNYSRGFWIFSLFLIFICWRSKSHTIEQKYLITWFCFYPIIFGLFMAAATVSEYHRLLIPVHYLMIPMAILFTLTLTKEATE